MSADEAQILRAHTDQSRWMVEADTHAIEALLEMTTFARVGGQWHPTRSRARTYRYPSSTASGRHTARTDLGIAFGATDVVAERGDEGIARVLELTGGHGTHTVLEAVGYRAAYDQALGVVRPGGVISRVGVP